MVDKIELSDAQWRHKLTAEEFEVCRQKGTERAFTGVYWDCKKAGLYRCKCCEAPLFRSNTKFESGTGWPSFWEPVSAAAVATHTDTSHGMARTEALCAACGAHLGHLFEDGPRDTTGLRYCINSVSLSLDEQGDDAAGG